MLFRSRLTQEMNPPVHIGVHCGIHLRDLIHHATRFLRCGGIVEVYQRLSVHLPGKDGKIAPYPGYIVVLSIYHLLLSVSSAHC